VKLRISPVEGCRLAYSHEILHLCNCCNARCGEFERQKWFLLSVMRVIAVLHRNNTLRDEWKRGP